MLGSAAGGILGSHFGHRATAAVPTALGALAGVPLFVLWSAQGERDVPVYIAGTVASIGGAVVGNSIGQR